MKLLHKPAEFDFINKFYKYNQRWHTTCLVCQKALDRDSEYVFCDKCRPLLEEVAPALNAINPDDYPGLNIHLDTGLLLIAVEKVLPELETTFWISYTGLIDKLKDIPEYQTVCKVRTPWKNGVALGRVMAAKGWHRPRGGHTYYNQPNEQRQELARMEEGAEA